MDHVWADRVRSDQVISHVRSSSWNAQYWLVMSGIGILHADHGTRDGEKEFLIRAIALKGF